MRSSSSFPKAELALGFTFTRIAFQSYESGNQESLAESIAGAEKAYEKVVQFLLDAKRSQRITESEIHDFTAELEQLREKLEKLEQLGRCGGTSKPGWPEKKGDITRARESKSTTGIRSSTG
jgi:hypothetical protein